MSRQRPTEHWAITMEGYLNDPRNPSWSPLNSRDGYALHQLLHATRTNLIDDAACNRLYIMPDSFRTPTGRIFNAPDCLFLFSVGMNKRWDAKQIQNEKWMVRRLIERLTGYGPVVVGAPKLFVDKLRAKPLLDSRRKLYA